MGSQGPAERTLSGEDPPRSHSRNQAYSAETGQGRGFLAEELSRHLRSVAVAFYARIHPIGSCALAAIHSVAPAPTKRLRVDEWSERNRSGPHCWFFRWSTFNAYFQKNARHHSQRTRAAEQDEPGGSHRALSECFFPYVECAITSTYIDH